MPTRYAPGRSWAPASATSARRRRRTRLRSTAEPTARPTAYATRAGGAPGTQVTVNTPARVRRPRRRSSANVARSRIRPGRAGREAAAEGSDAHHDPAVADVAAAIKRTGRGGPCAGELSRWPARHGSTYGAESRGSWPACGYWAGRCASRSSLLGSAGNLPRDRDSSSTTPRRRRPGVASQARGCSGKATTGARPTPGDAHPVAAKHPSGPCAPTRAGCYGPVRRSSGRVSRDRVGRRGHRRLVQGVSWCQVGPDLSTVCGCCCGRWVQVGGEHAGR